MWGFLWGDNTMILNRDARLFESIVSRLVASILYLETIRFTEFRDNNLGDRRRVSWILFRFTLLLNYLFRRDRDNFLRLNLFDYNDLLLFFFGQLFFFSLP